MRPVEVKHDHTRKNTLLMRRSEVDEVKLTMVMRLLKELTKLQVAMKS